MHIWQRTPPNHKRGGSRRPHEILHWVYMRDLYFFSARGVYKETTTTSIHYERFCDLAMHPSVPLHVDEIQQWLIPRLFSLHAFHWFVRQVGSAATAPVEHANDAFLFGCIKRGRFQWPQFAAICCNHRPRKHAHGNGCHITTKLPS